jgi:uncharacterized protein YecA (UPF0149 family)
MVKIIRPRRENGIDVPIVFPKKPGRNDKCHCGNGFKYKDCCMIADDRKIWG